MKLQPTEPHQPGQILFFRITTGFYNDATTKSRFQVVEQKKFIADLIIAFWEIYLQYTSTLIDFIAGDPKPFSALQ